MVDYRARLRTRQRGVQRGRATRPPNAALTPPASAGGAARSGGTGRGQEHRTEHREDEPAAGAEEDAGDDAADEGAADAEPDRRGDAHRVGAGQREPASAPMTRPETASTMMNAMSPWADVTPAGARANACAPSGIRHVEHAVVVQLVEQAQVVRRVLGRVVPARPVRGRRRRACAAPFRAAAICGADRVRIDAGALEPFRYSSTPIPCCGKRYASGPQIARFWTNRR